MARRSQKRVSLCIVLFISAIHMTPMCAGADQIQGDAPSKDAASIIVNVLAREMAFVRSFSPDYPGQFGQQESGREKSNIISVEEMGTGKR